MQLQRCSFLCVLLVGMACLKGSLEAALEQQRASYQQLQGDMSTMYRQHKDEVARMEAALQSGTYETRLAALVAENRTLSTRVRALADAQPALRSTAALSGEAASALQRVVATLEARADERPDDDGVSCWLHSASLARSRTRARCGRSLGELPE